MEKYLRQEYDGEMHKLLKEDNLEYDSIGEALLDAYYAADSADVVVLWRRSSIDPHRLVKIAKFY